MARVFRARMSLREDMNRILAIKTIRIQVAEQEEYRRMFNREVAISASFSHPNIVAVYDFGEYEYRPFIAMEYIEGVSLKQLQTRLNLINEILSLETILFIIDKAANALKYAHHFQDKLSGKIRQIIHRDLSPQNILISYEGIVKLIDFGIAKTNFEKDNTEAGIIQGKLNYMAPEQIRGFRVDERTDLFALGVILWELLTQKRLFDSDNISENIDLVLNESNVIVAPSNWNSQVPPILDEFCLKLLARNPDQRCQNAQEVISEIGKIMATLPHSTSENELGSLLRKLFKTEIVEDRELLAKFNDRANSLMRNDPDVTNLAQKSDINDSKIPSSSAAPQNLTFKIETDEGKPTVPHLSGSNAGLNQISRAASFWSREDKFRNAFIVFLGVIAIWGALSQLKNYYPFQILTSSKKQVEKSNPSLEIPTVNIISPEKGSVIASSRPIIRWNFSGPVTYFFVDISTDPQFHNFWNHQVDLPNTQVEFNGSSGGWNGVSPSSQAPDNLVDGRLYYARVAAFYNSGTHVVHSDTVSFQVQTRNLGSVVDSTSASSESPDARDIHLDHSINGYVDVLVKQSDGSYFLHGWACAKNYSGSIYIDVYFGGHFGVGTPYGRFTANKPSEPAVGNLCQSTGANYRFIVPIPASSANTYKGQGIFIHGINPFDNTGASNSVLPNSGKTKFP